MRRNVRSTVSCLLAFLWLTGCAAPEPDKQEIHLLAASSLTDAVKELEKRYETTHPHVDILPSFASSGKLKQQIRQGAPADVFLSAGEREMDELEQSGKLLPGARSDILTNELVLVVPRNGGEKVQSWTDLTPERIGKLAVGQPETVPAGQYAKAALEKDGRWGKLLSRIVFASNVRQVLAFTASGNVDAGLVYRTDAKGEERVKAVSKAPRGSHPPIRYPGAVLKGSDNVKQASSFYRWLKGDEAVAVWRKHGFRGIAAQPSS
ncbi:molybdate ABC transporter substrate-binding protein [Salinithrix halophila]|uniref:Molybdate ABC transporter substrate-binding protein n=1 Tax=Salinithrix halophila TaxID=1485204 RepID=A0ABV8JI59_9BACL